MATEYGIKVDNNITWAEGFGQAVDWVRVVPGASMIAREVSEPRIVSIRA